jgi:DHA1 family inner membrane transport protein
VMSSFSIASTFGVPFALYLANLFSWHAPFILVGSVGIIIIPLIMKFVPSMKNHIERDPLNTSRKKDVLLDVLKHPRQRLALLFSGMIMMGHFLIVPFINPFTEFNNHYTKKQTPMIYLVGGIASFFAANMLGKLSDQHGKMRVFTICVLLSLPLVIIITQLPRIFFPLVLVLFGLWFILSTGRGVTAQAMVSSVVEPQKRGSFMSFNSSIQQLGTSFASLFAGFIVVNGENGEIFRYEWLGYSSVFILLTCVIIGLRIFRKSDQLLTHVHEPVAVPAD